MRDDDRIAELLSEMLMRLDRHEKQFQSIDNRFERMEQVFTHGFDFLADRLKPLAEQQEQTNQRVSDLDRTVGTLAEVVNTLAGTVNKLASTVGDLHHAQVETNQRLSAIEKKLDFK